MKNKCPGKIKLAYFDPDRNNTTVISMQNLNKYIEMLV